MTESSCCDFSSGERAEVASKGPQQLSYLDLKLRAILEATISDSDVELTVSNLAGLPVLVRTGSEDNSVPPHWSRRMARLLSDVPGVDLVWSELAGKQHWWWDSKETNDGGAVFDRAVRNFYKVVQAPFAVVAGGGEAAGDDVAESAASAVMAAAVYMANGHFAAVETTAPVILDTMPLPSQARNTVLVGVGFGNQSSNAAASLNNAVARK
eukprot:gene18143-21612_t